MSLRRAYVGTWVLETSENYALADAPLVTPPESPATGEVAPLDEDRRFWEIVFRFKDEVWGATVGVGMGVAVSEWVARVPGLFWRPGAQAFRQYEQERYTLVRGWHVYEPRLKSAKVMGGVGTMRLPMADNGARLISLCTGLNASAGVPALVSADVWDKIASQGPYEGRVIRFEQGARWMRMASAWAANFQTTRDLPRGYVVLNDPDAVEVLDDVAPVLIHPFTVMEYREGAKELFDFVYASADTSNRDYRAALEQFFGWYAGDAGRFGRYLLAGDMLNPMWDAQFDTPADLRRSDPAAGSQLELLEERVRRSMLADDAVDDVMDALGKVARNQADFERLSADIGVEFAVWHRGGVTPAEAASLFVEEVLRQDKLAELIEVLVRLYPALMEN